MYIIDPINNTNLGYKFLWSLIVTSFWSSTMFISEFVPGVKLLVRRCNFLRCIPFEFNPQSQRFSKCKSNWTNRFFQIQGILSVLYTIALFLNVCIGQRSVAQTFQGAVFFVVYLLCVVGKWNYSLDVAPIQIINAILDFERNVITGKHFHTK